MKNSIADGVDLCEHSWPHASVHHWVQFTEMSCEAFRLYVLLRSAVVFESSDGPRARTVGLADDHLRRLLMPGMGRLPRLDELHTWLQELLDRHVIHGIVVTRNRPPGTRAFLLEPAPPRGTLAHHSTSSLLDTLGEER